MSSPLDWKTREAKSKESAEEIEVSALPPAQAKFVKKLESKFGHPVQVWEGIHGIIVEFNSQGGGRLMKDSLKLLLSDSNFRWVDADNRRVAVGM